MSQTGWCPSDKLWSCDNQAAQHKQLALPRAFWQSIAITCLTVVSSDPTNPQ